jgi:histidyl-tRNA synthetase
VPSAKSDRSSRDVFRAPVGTHDVLPPDSAAWEEVVAAFASRARRFGFGLIVTPVFEHYDVIERVGESTDVVSKEVYELTDKGGRRLALRPEGTAPVVRAYVQHRPRPPWKVWYVAPNFRYERPQKGRYRQHWQLGAEVLGVDEPAVDVEVIALAHGFYADVGLHDARLLVNSMGDEESRARYVDVLLGYWRDHADLLGAEIARAEANPLRILDSRRDDWYEMLERAPQLWEYLTDDAAAHFEKVQQGLHDLGIEFEIAPRLVRGFDYYTGTAFEFQSGALDAAQNAVGGGGRYDRLAEEMGGPPTPGIGFGIGIERLLLARAAQDGAREEAGTHVDVFVVDALDDGGRRASVLVHELRDAGLATDRSFGLRSAKTVKKQLATADRSGARWAVLLLPQEHERRHAAVKDLRSGEQVEVRSDEVVAWLLTREDGVTVPR